MICPFCLHTKTSVYNSRTTKKINEIWRRRRCETCGNEFTTRERAQADTIIRVRNGKTTIPYLQSRLLLSLLRACDHRQDDEAIFYLIEAVHQALFKQAASKDQVVTTSEIADITSEILQRFDPIAYVKYVTA